MNKYLSLTAVFVALTAGSALADESPAEDFGQAQLQAWKERAEARQGATDSRMYPVNKRIQIFETVDRACTKLETAAGVEEADCGRLPLNEVVSMYMDLNDE